MQSCSWIKRARHANDSPAPNDPSAPIHIKT